MSPHRTPRLVSEHIQQYRFSHAAETGQNKKKHRPCRSARHMSRCRGSSGAGLCVPAAPPDDMCTLGSIRAAPDKSGRR